jgi:hypothetical protein
MWISVAGIAALSTVTVPAANSGKTITLPGSCELLKVGSPPPPLWWWAATAKPGTSSSAIHASFTARNIEYIASSKGLSLSWLWSP